MSLNPQRLVGIYTEPITFGSEAYVAKECAQRMPDMDAVVAEHGVVYGNRGDWLHATQDSTHVWEPFISEQYDHKDGIASMVAQLRGSMADAQAQRAECDAA